MANKAFYGSRTGDLLINKEKEDVARFNREVRCIGRAVHVLEDRDALDVGGGRWVAITPPLRCRLASYPKMISCIVI